MKPLQPPARRELHPLRRNELIQLLALLTLLALIGSVRGKIVERSAERPPPDVASLDCLRSAGQLLQAVSCDSPHALRIDARLPDRERSALGMRPCWWTAGEAELRKISGVGPATATRLLEHRDSGGRPDRDSVILVRGIGPRLSVTVERSVDSRCGVCADAAARPRLDALRISCEGG